jgi:alpha-galactosidase
MASMRLAALAIFLAVDSAVAINDGLGLTPPMGVNSWTSFGTGVTAADLISMGQFFVTSGMRAAGYDIVCSE